MKFDFKGWKKVKDHKDHATFRNERGHELRVAKKGLSKKLLKDLDALQLADGGYVKDDKKPKPKIPEVPVDKGHSKESVGKQLKKAFGMNKGGEVQKKNYYVPTGKGLTDEMYLKEVERVNQTHKELQQMYGIEDSKKEKKMEPLHPENYADGGEIVIGEDTPPEESLGRNPLTQLTVDQPAMSQDITSKSDLDAGLAMSGPAALAQTSGTPTTVQSIAPTQQAMAQTTAQTPEQMLVEGVSAEKAANMAQAAAVGKLAKDQAKAYEQALAAQSEDDLNTGMASEHIDNEIKSLAQDINAGHIDANRYVSNMSGGQKVMTAIGLILGGIGSGLTGGENPALRLLEKNIENDIHAQQAEMSKKQNLLGAFQKQYGDTVTAANMYRLTRAEMLKDQLGLAAAKNGSQMAMVNAAKANAAIDAKMAPIKAQLAADMGKKAGSSNQDIESRLRILRITNPQAAKDLEQRMVPGMGLANTAEDAKKMKDISADAMAAKESIKRLKEINKISGKSLSPSLRAEAYSLSKGLVGQLNRPFTGGGPMSEAERELLGTIARNPTAIFALDSSNKVALDTLERTLDNKVRAAAMSSGINMPSKQDQLTPQQRKFYDWAIANPNDPKAKLVLEKLGF